MEKLPELNRSQTEPQPRVLIVDDNPAVLFAYCRMLRHEGMCVDICECLPEAVRLIKSRAYFAVITDLRLSGTDNTDGLDVIRAMQTARPGTRVILTTGYGNREIELKSRSLGATHYFEKPVTPSVIMSALKSLGDKECAV